MDALAKSEFLQKKLGTYRVRILLSMGFPKNTGNDYRTEVSCSETLNNIKQYKPVQVDKKAKILHKNLTLNTYFRIHI